MRARQAWLAGLLLAVAMSGTGCTGGDTPDDAGVTSSPTSAATPTSAAPDDSERIAGYASAFLGAGALSGTDEAFVHMTVWAPPGEEPFANGEFFVLGYDCLTEQTVPATVEPLESATASGELALTCGSHTHSGEVTGTAVVDLEWTAEGPVREHTVEGPDGCTEDISDRHAVVRGEVRLVLPALGYDGVATTLADDDDSVSQGVSTCA